MWAGLLAQDPDETAILSLVLQRAGLSVAIETDPDAALAKWGESPPDLLVIALFLSDPLSALQHLHDTTPAPIILIFDSLAEDQHLALLKAGADLVLERPYSARLLVAQTEALLRQSGRRAVTVAPSLHYQEFTIDPALHSVQVGDQPPRRLTSLEFRLLHTLMLHPNQILTTDQLINRVWGYTDGGSREMLHRLISRLRAKLGSSGGRTSVIETVAGVGYVFRG